MKKLVSVFCAITFAAFLFNGCDDDSDYSIGGSPSELGNKGVIITSSSQPIAGISGFSATVTSVEDGVSVFEGHAVITNNALKQILSNVPGLNISEDNVSVSGVKVKFTDKGIENKYPFYQGILVKFNAKVGDTYPVKDSDTERKVIYKSTTDDFDYAFYKIKVIEVEHEINFHGLKKINYWVNHKFGLVKVQFELDNGETIAMPFYSGSLK
ncbi:MAG TPA: hypothetical protein PK028_07435 [Bacteroidales bacterium]|jgi:hypothetical protein|nr:hypothetical protein [Bacteroidales bacterium]MDI9573519.1 hypothetical protein [Bacteroidota bacterium]OQC59215.1 MAG: hypothetical protein BWX51_01642 [Bacteroidetes bacterium ADurb.Bin012]MBP9512430.1 hypothetical protein [Bacteroidales bacterium]MBP9588869.1 hypothetical protein [Bacteroidales bacterium]